MNGSMQTQSMEAKEVAHQRAEDHNADKFLLKLPGEIRNQIYKLYWDPLSRGTDNFMSISPKNTHIAHQGGSWRIKHDHIFPGLAQVCRQIRIEFQPLCMQGTEIDLTPSHIGKFLHAFREQDIRTAFPKVEWYDHHADLLPPPYATYPSRGPEVVVPPWFCFRKMPASGVSTVIELVAADAGFKLTEPGPDFPRYSAHDLDIWNGGPLDDRYNPNDLTYFPHIWPKWQRYMEDIAALIVKLVAERYNEQIHVWFPSEIVRFFMLERCALEGMFAVNGPPNPAWEPSTLLPLVQEFLEAVFVVDK